jgi:hypothetical protein
MFRVVTKGFDESFHRWTDALEAGNKLRPKCRSLLQDIRISEDGNVVWVPYSPHVLWGWYLRPIGKVIFARKCGRDGSRRDLKKRAISLVITRFSAKSLNYKLAITTRAAAKVLSISASV